MVHALEVSRQDEMVDLTVLVAQCCAARNLFVDAEIAAAVGRTVTRVQAVEDSERRLVADLELDCGAGRLRLCQEPRREDAPPARGRGR